MYTDNADEVKCEDCGKVTTDYDHLTHKCHECCVKTPLTQEYEY